MMILEMNDPDVRRLEKYFIKNLHGTVRESELVEDLVID